MAPRLTRARTRSSSGFSGNTYCFSLCNTFPGSFCTDVLTRATRLFNSGGVPGLPEDKIRRGSPHNLSDVGPLMRIRRSKLADPLAGPQQVQKKAGDHRVDVQEKNPANF